MLMYSSGNSFRFLTNVNLFQWFYHKSIPLCRLIQHLFVISFQKSQLIRILLLNYLKHLWYWKQLFKKKTISKKVMINELLFHKASVYFSLNQIYISNIFILSTKRILKCISVVKLYSLLSKNLQKKFKWIKYFKLYNSLLWLDLCILQAEICIGHLSSPLDSRAGIR